MEIEIFTLCDHAQDVGGKLFISGTFDILNSAVFPCIHPSCSIAGRLRFSSKELGTYKFKLKGITPDGKDLMPPIEGDIKIGKPDLIDYTSTNFAINLLQLKLETPGYYSFELYLDNEWKTGLKLFAQKQ